MHPTACGARLLQLSRDAFHPPHIHLRGRRVQERDSRVGGPEAGVDGSGTGAHSPLGPGRPRRWEREAAAAAAGRARGAGCRCGGGRRGAPGALRGAARRWAAGARGRRGSGRRALHARERRAPSSRAFRRRPCHLLPITTALGAGAVAPATQRPDLKESRGDDGLQAAPRGPLLAVRRLAQNAQVDSAGAPLGQLDWTWCAKLGAESEGHQQGSARRCPSP